MPLQDQVNASEAKTMYRSFHSVRCGYAQIHRSSEEKLIVSNVHICALFHLKQVFVSTILSEAHIFTRFTQNKSGKWNCLVNALVHL